MLKLLPICDIYPDPDQLRKSGMDDESIAAVADSVAAVGIIQNLRVTPDGQGRYKIVAGERRYRGALKAGLTELPAYIDSELTDVQRIEIQLVENIVRRDLSVRERAEGIARLLQLNPDRSYVMKLLGISKGHLSQLLELTSLKPEVAALTEAGVTKDATTIALVNQLAKRAPEHADALITQAKEKGKLTRKEVTEALAPLRRPKEKKSGGDSEPPKASTQATDSFAPHLEPVSTASPPPPPSASGAEEPISFELEKAPVDEQRVVRCPPKAKIKRVCALLSLSEDTDPAIVLERLVDSYLGLAATKRAA